MKDDWRARLDQEFEAANAYRPNKADWLDGRWAGREARLSTSEDERRGKTGVPLETLREIGAKLTSAPADFHIHRTIQRFLDNRDARRSNRAAAIDWATAEALAFGSLLARRP